MVDCHDVTVAPAASDVAMGEDAEVEVTGEAGGEAGGGGEGEAQKRRGKKRGKQASSGVRRRARRDREEQPGEGAPG